MISPQFRSRLSPPTPADVPNQLLLSRLRAPRTPGSIVLALALALTFLFIRSVAADSDAVEGGDVAAAIDDPDPLFDRLDGTGRSGKRVDVVEWEGNLEIHAYPKGSLRGLGTKLVRERGKKILIVSYRFDTTARPLIRRVLVSIPLREGFEAYRDFTADDYDKIILSNHGLALGKGLASFARDPEPTATHPDDPRPGDTRQASAEATPSGSAPSIAAQRSGAASRAPASVPASGRQPSREPSGETARETAREDLIPIRPGMVAPAPAPERDTSDQVRHFSF